MRIKRNVITTIETEHKLGIHGVRTVGQLIDELIRSNIDNEERLAQIILDFDPEEWEALAS